MKSKKYHTVWTVKKFNINIAGRGIFDTPNAQIHERSLFILFSVLFFDFLLCLYCYYFRIHFVFVYSNVSSNPGYHQANHDHLFTSDSILSWNKKLHY